MGDRLLAAPLADPLAVTEGLARAAAAGHWLNTTELAQLLGMASGMIRSWSAARMVRRSGGGW